MTVSPQGGDGCSGSNENQSRLERQLEWSRHIGINELKRIYGASLFLRCTAYLFYALAVLYFCLTAAIFFIDTLPEFLCLYPEWTLLFPILLFSTHYLKKLKMPPLCRKTITMLQIGLVVAVGYFFFDYVIHCLIINPYNQFKSGMFGGYYHHGCNFLEFFIIFILLKMDFDMLWNGRSRQIRIFLIVMSLSWGIFGGIVFPMIFAVICGVLMGAILWIAAFSKVRHQLFRSDALSHKQLYAVLEQKKREIPDEKLVVQEDHKDISLKKYLQKIPWIFPAVQIIAAFLVFYAPNYEWFLHKSAELGCAQAQFCLAHSYSHGIGVKKNEAQSLKWFRKAAEQGIAEAQFSLAQYYSRGIGVEKNDTEAIKWYLKSAEQGISEAKLRLGLCYVGGIGVRKDNAEADKWFRKYLVDKSAALKKDYQSQTALNLAKFYIVFGEYDRAISFLDDPRLRQNKKYKICCPRTYMKACALLAKGQSAEAEIRQFNQFFPGNWRIDYGWDVTAFRLWLKSAELSDQARKTIFEMTDRFAYGK